MCNWLGTDLIVVDDAIVLLSQHQDRPVIVPSFSELSNVLWLWGFDMEEVEFSVELLNKNKHNHINFGMFNSLIITSNKTEEEFEDMVGKYAQYNMVS